jgi:hypothetical protein
MNPKVMKKDFVWGLVVCCLLFGVCCLGLHFVDLGFGIGDWGFVVWGLLFFVLMFVVFWRRFVTGVGNRCSNNDQNANALLPVCNRCR